MKDTRRRRLTASIILTLAALLAAAPALWAQEKVEADGGGPRPIPLINADEDMAGHVRKAQELIEQKDYATAIEILHALLTRKEQCFVSAGGSGRRRFISLAARASSVIGSLPKEGLELYRRLYDPQADRLLRTAAETFDEAALRDVVRRYFHTRHGDRALNLLGAILFDRGEFSQAARCWGDILDHYADTELDRAVLLSKIVVAHHFAGEDRRAEEAMARLGKEHPKAEAVLGGQKTGVVAFAERMLKMTPPDFATGRVMHEGWFSLAGAPDGVAVMSPCRPVLSPRWTRPKGKIDDNVNLRTLFQGSLQSRRVVVNGRVQNVNSTAMELKEGHIQGVMRVGNKVTKVPLPALIHPVVAGTTVIVREADAVRGYDLLTGEETWSTNSDFPLYRRVERVGTNRYYNPYGYMNRTEDQGLCTLTIGGGKVFALGNFAPPVAQRYVNPRTGASQIADTSALRALSLAGEGRLVWRTDDPARDDIDDILRAGKFLCAPTFAAGKLYAIIEYIQAYYVVCLNADNGRLIWKTLASQAPIGMATYAYNMMVNDEFGSAPAVADGRVFVLTNAGVVAAFEADTGRGIWAYQYDSWRNQSVDSSRQVSYQKAQNPKTYPPNPVIVARGRVVCLPADSEEVLALRADTGEPVWSPKDRHNQRFMAAIDDGRVVLVGPNLMVMDVRTGKSDWPSPQITDVEGRPAVTTEAILASGKGKVFFVSLNGFAVTQPPLVAADAILGNLVCAHGKLIAANAAGASAYFTFDDAHRELSERIARAADNQAPMLLYQRGMNAFNAGKPDEALPDLLAARTKAKAMGDSAVLARTEQSLYRTYISLANKARTDAEALDLLKKAEGFVYSDRSRAELLVRYAKYHEKVGQHAQAAALAHKLTTAFPQTDMVDVEFGPRADPFVRDDPDTPRLDGYALGHQLVKELIGRRGQSCYAAFDAKAKAELDLAAGAKDPDGLVRVADTYRHSTYAPVTLLKAAELHYAAALAAGQKNTAVGHLSEAGLLLSRTMMEYSRSPQAASASLGLAMVYQRMRPQIAWLGLQGLTEVDTNARVSFADVDGRLGEVLSRFDSAGRRAHPVPEPLSFAIRPPMKKLYEAADGAVVLRNAEGQPVRIGEKFFVLRGSKLVLFDPLASGPKETTAWENPVPLDGNRLYRYGFAAWQYGLMAGLTTDGKALVFGSRGGFAGVDANNGKVLWSKGASDRVVSQLMGMAMDDDLLVVQTAHGRDCSVSAVDMKTGKTVWEQKLPQSAYPWRLPPQVGGGILVTVYGQNQWSAGIYDLKSKKHLGQVPLGVNLGQATVTPDGLVLINDGHSIKLIEPILGMDRPIWKVDLPKASQPAILAALGTKIVVSPDFGSGLVEVRSIAHYGRIERTVQTDNVAGQTAVPVSVEVRGERLYVLTSVQAGNLVQNRLAGRLTYCMMPSLQVFDLKTGKLLWKVQLETPNNTPAYVMPPQIGTTHVTLLVKPTSWNQDSTAYVLDANDGKAVQKITISGAQGAAQGAAVQTRYFRHQSLASPVMASGRIIVETTKGLAVHGGSQ